jgi:peptidoglycan-N-acetylglucosamine deacetylase
MNLDVIACLVLVVLLTLVGLAIWRPITGRAERQWLRAARLAVVLLVAVALVAFGAYGLMNARSVQLFGHQVASVASDTKVVALTFDDGPADENVDAVLADLRRYGAQGTFFVVGSAAQRQALALRKLIGAGEEIGNHGFQHRRLVFVSTGMVAREVEATDRVIRSAGYGGPIYFRPPFGKRLISAPYYLSRHDRVTIMWDLEPDSIGSIADDPAAMSEYVARNVHPGSIILLHVWNDGRSASRAALPMILARLSAQGYSFVTVSKLLAGT